MSVELESVSHIKSIIQAINSKTGCKHLNLKSAVQSLCDGYIQPAPLYSFGVLSDLHIQYETGVADLQRALSYLKETVAFTCVAGDLVSYATEDHMSAYKDCVDNYAGDMPVYECAGNHETYPSLGVAGDIDESMWNTYTGKSLYYSFSYGEDVFVMIGLKSERADDLFPDGALDWLQSTLEENKNKRCFVFMHAPELADKTADPSGAWSTLMSGTSGAAFVNLIKSYKNTVWFHGHTHVTLGVEQYPVASRETLGYNSVHIPSLVSPRFYDSDANTLVDYYYDENNNKIWGSSLSEGYIVDVYENQIVIRGINFAAGSDQLQVAAFSDEVYILDTVLQST